LPIAGRVRAVAGVDPEPDMLARAWRAAREQGIANVSWMIGTDTDIPAIRALLGGQRAGAVTIAQALHWMNHDELFRAAVPLIRPGGGIAVITNGTSLWLQDTAWSRALRRFLEQWLGTTTTATCGTDAASQRRYRDSLPAPDERPPVCRADPPRTAAARANDRARPRGHAARPYQSRPFCMRPPGPADAVGGNGRDFAGGWNGRSGFFVLGLRTGRRPR
jgi:SAM-dependent methyltransferase